MPFEDRTKLTYNGWAVSRALPEPGMDPSHPGGALPSPNQRSSSIKHEVNQVPYEVPSELEVSFVDYYNNRRYHKALSNGGPMILHGRREEILIKRREVKARTLASRKRYNHLLRESKTTTISP